MKARAWILTITIAAVAASACKGPQPPAPQAARPDPVARGQYLVEIAGCGDCHTPLKIGEKGPEPDLTRLLSGHPADLVMPKPPPPSGPWEWYGAATLTAFAGPWGTTYAINLTPDPNTGIAVWTEETFIEAMRTGQHWLKNRPIMPPMPWQSLAKMTDDDLKAVFAYLRSIPPIENKVPEYQPPAAPEAK